MLGIIFVIWPNVAHSLAFIVLIVLAVFDEKFGWMRFLQRRITRAKKTVHQASTNDKSWDEPAIMQQSRELINHYRADWVQKDFMAISKYATDRFGYHNRLFIEALNNLDRTITLDATINDVEVIGADDTYDHEQDNFTVYVVSQEKLDLIDAETKQVIKTFDSDVEELYGIERENDIWKLSSLSRAKEGNPVVYQPFQEYAHQQGFYYSNRTSHLLLPYKTELTIEELQDTGHVVLGVHNNLLVTVFLLEAKDRSRYAVASTTLPVGYPHILIRNRAVTDISTENFKRISLDWPAFNEHYELFVADAATESVLLSLLNPELVTFLINLPGSISIEIKDRSVYVILDNNYELLQTIPEVLSQLHRRALLSAATRTLLKKH
ncbi:MAG: hypothetical protein QG553_129 [Patescibacteria group bacterium]|nr:hypothetical protein [Patescibacteria group bacterium]